MLIMWLYPFEVPEKLNQGDSTVYGWGQSLHGTWICHTLCGLNSWTHATLCRLNCVSVYKLEHCFAQSFFYSSSGSWIRTWAQLHTAVGYTLPPIMCWHQKQLHKFSHLILLRTLLPWWKKFKIANDKICCSHILHSTGILDDPTNLCTPAENTTEGQIY